MDALEENGVCEATQAVETAASDFIYAICELFNEVEKVIAAAIDPVVEWLSSIDKQLKKRGCNNWRRMHGLPMLHRNKSCRHIQSFHHNIVTR